MIKNRLLGAAAALVVSASFASAADLYRAPPPAAPVAPVLIPTYVWTGGFVGVNVGYGWGDVGKRRGLRSADVDGFLAGVHGGFNWQYNALVVGADTSWSWSGMDANGKGRRRGISTDINWAGDFRARAGFAFDRVHLYAAAGLALADIDQRGFRRRGAGSTETGWTAGLGAEYAITNNFVAGLEWKYSDYGKVRGLDVSTNVVMLRASYKF